MVFWGERRSFIYLFLLIIVKRVFIASLDLGAFLIVAICLGATFVCVNFGWNTNEPIAILGVALILPISFSYVVVVVVVFSSSHHHHHHHIIPILALVLLLTGEKCFFLTLLLSKPQCFACI